MNLTYRGNAYTPNVSDLKTDELPLEGIFLGHRYKLKRHTPSVVTHRQPSSQGTYRGVHYVH